MQDLEKNRDILKRPSKSHHKRCPKCHSVFITEAECESCGFQFQKKLKSVFSHHSFYALRGDYESEMEIFYRLFPKLLSKDHPVRKKYTLLYMNRVRKLIGYFSHSDHSAAQLRLFLTEFEDLCEEALRLKVSADSLFESIEHCQNEILRQKLFEVASAAQGKVESSSSFSFLDKRLLGTFRYSYLLKLLFAVTLVSWVALEVFKRNF